VIRDLDVGIVRDAVARLIVDQSPTTNQLNGS
jgi:hypothetical protein